MVVARRDHRLRQVDNNWPERAEQHVVFGEVAVNQTGAEHAHDLLDHEPVPLAGLLRGQLDVTDLGSGIPVLILHQFHQQNTVIDAVRFRHAHAGCGQVVQSIHLCALPLRFLHLAAMTAALAGSPRIAAAASLAAFRVVGGLLETTVLRVLVDLCAADLVTAGHHVDRRFLAALKLADDRVHQAVLDQRL